jgi:hypothetical protein
MLADELGSSVSQNAPENNRHDERVVQRASDRNEVRDQIDGQSQVGGERREQNLVSTRNAGVVENAGAKDYAVRNEACPRSCICPTSEKEQQENGGDVEHERNAQCNANRTPDAHDRTLTVKLPLLDPRVARERLPYASRLARSAATSAKC